MQLQVVGMNAHGKTFTNQFIMRHYIKRFGKIKDCNIYKNIIIIVINQIEDGVK